MFGPQRIDEMTKQFIDSLPPGLKAWQDAISNHFHQYLQNAFNNLSLVTREEFDIQTQVLAKTRAKLEGLEVTLRELDDIIQHERKP